MKKNNPGCGCCGCPAEDCNSFSGDTFVEASTVKYDEIQVVVAGLPTDLVFWQFANEVTSFESSWYKITVYNFSSIEGTYIFNRRSKDGSGDQCKVGITEGGILQSADFVDVDLSYQTEEYEDSGAFREGTTIYDRGCPITDYGPLNTFTGTCDVGLSYTGHDYSAAFTNPPPSGELGELERMMVDARRWSSVGQKGIIQGVSLPSAYNTRPGSVVKDITDDRAKKICDKLTHTMRFNVAVEECGVPAQILESVISVTRLQS